MYLTLLLVPLMLHKALPVLIQPLGLCLLLGIAALLMKKRWPAVVGFSLLFVCSLGVVSGPLLGTLENQYPVLEVSACPQADAAIVLGGVTKDDLRTSTLEWGTAVNRFERGLDLLRAGRVRYLVFTSARLPWQRDTQEDEGTQLRTAAIARGAAPERILLTDGVVQNTAGEAQELGKMMSSHGWRRVVVVTSAFHMSRAMFLMRRAGVNAVPFPTDFNTDPTHSATALDYLPSADALRMTEIFVREALGLLYYQLLSPPATPQ